MTPEDGTRDQLAAELEAADTPAPEQPESPEPTEGEDTPSPATDDWQKRYTDLQPEYTRATQEAAQLRNIIELARQGDAEAMEYLGWNAAEDDDTDDDDLDDDEPMTRAEFQQFLSQQQEALNAQQSAEEELERDASFIESEFERLEKEHGEFTDEERDALVEFAAFRRDDEGNPAVEAAFKILNAAVDKKHKAYLKSKKAAMVSVGQAGTEKIDLNDDEAKTQFFADLIEAGEE